MPERLAMTEQANAVRPLWGKNLSEREYRFVCEYLVDLNATRAIIRCGFEGARATAAQVGYETFRRPHVRLAINRALSKDSSSTQQWLIDQLSRIVEGDITELLDWEAINLGGFVIVPGPMRLKALNALPREKRKLIKKLKIDAFGTMTFELYPRDKAIEQLGRTKVIGLFGEDETKGDGLSLEDLLGRVEKKMVELRIEEQSMTTIEQPGLPAPAKSEDSSA